MAANTATFTPLAERACNQEWRQNDLGEKDAIAKMEVGEILDEVKLREDKG